MTPYFPFVQFEFADFPGPAPGRYVVRREPPADGEPAVTDADELLDGADILVVRRRGAPPATGGLLRRRPRPVASDAEPGEVAITTCTLVRATRRLASAKDAARLLRDITDSSDEQEAWIGDALELLNLAVAAYRVCAVDPYAVDVARARARATRIGYGTGAQVFAGAWDEAIAIAPPRPPRISREGRLQPLEGIASILGGASRLLESEELILRVMLDLDAGRARAAAVSLEAALALLEGEVADEPLSGVALRQLETALGARGRIAELAAVACRRDLVEPEVAELTELAGEVGTVVDGWRYKGIVA